VTMTSCWSNGHLGSFSQYEATCRYFATSQVGGSSNYNGPNILPKAETEMATLSWPALLIAGGIAGVGMFSSSR